MLDSRLPQLSKQTAKRLMYLCHIFGQCVIQDQSLQNYQATTHFWLVKESLMLFSQLCRVVPALFQVLSGVVKPVFRRLCLNTPTLIVLFMSDVASEVTRWLRYLTTSLNLRLKSKANNTILCSVPAWSLIHQTCQSQLERPQFTQVSP